MDNKDLIDLLKDLNCDFIPSEGECPEGSGCKLCDMRRKALSTLQQEADQFHSDSCKCGLAQYWEEQARKLNDALAEAHNATVQQEAEPVGRKSIQNIKAVPGCCVCKGVNPKSCLMCGGKPFKWVPADDDSQRSELLLTAAECLRLVREKASGDGSELAREIRTMIDGFLWESTPQPAKVQVPDAKRLAASMYQRMCDLPDPEYHGDGVEVTLKELEVIVSDELDSLSASPEPAKGEWEPIETAPLDGTPLLLTWWDSLTETWAQEVKPAGNLDIARQGEGYHHGHATHWMHLPNPPQEG